MTPISQRIKEIVDFYTPGNPQEFGRRIGHAYQKITRLYKKDIRNDNNTNPSGEILSAIVNTFTEIDSFWLLTGKGEMLKSISKDYKPPEQINEVEDPQIKIFSWPDCIRKEKQIEELKDELKSQRKTIDNLNERIDELKCKIPLTVAAS